MTKITSQTLFIINPRAGNGAVERKIGEIKMMIRKFFPDHQILVTTGPGKATEYARLALETGILQVICVGGDGTLNEVVNGLMALKVEKAKRPHLGYLPLGTGSDLAKALGITTNIENGLRNIANGSGKWVDVGLATFTGHNRKNTSRYFINVLSFALGGEVAGRVNQSSKTMGAFLTFLLATLTTMLTFKKPLIRLQIDDRIDKQITCWHVAVANGQYQGGGVHIAPEAKLDDGRLRVTVVGDLSLPEVLMNLPTLCNGGIYSVAEVYRFTGRRIEAGSKTPVLLDIDGEQAGHLPVQAEILPMALWMVF